MAQVLPRHASASTPATATVVVVPEAEGKDRNEKPPAQGEDRSAHDESQRVSRSVFAAPVAHVLKPLGAAAELATDAIADVADFTNGAVEMVKSGVVSDVAIAKGQSDEAKDAVLGEVRRLRAMAERSRFSSNRLVGVDKKGGAATERASGPRKWNAWLEQLLCVLGFSRKRSCWGHVACDLGCLVPASRRVEWYEYPSGFIYDADSDEHHDVRPTHNALLATVPVASHARVPFLLTLCVRCPARRA